MLGCPKGTRSESCCQMEMFLDPAVNFLAGALPKPTIQMVPGNVVTSGNQVTIFCEGPLHAKEYRLYKEGSEDNCMSTTLLETENKARFYISLVQWNHAGRYWCSYKSLTNMSEQKSDIMELVVTGEKTLPQPHDLS